MSVGRERGVSWAGCAPGAGCAGSLSESRVASAREVMCKHCNCLMPAGLDPELMCPVCNCRKTVRECIRGN